MIDINSDLMCCGILEIGDISENKKEPEETIKEFAYQFYEEEVQGAFILFSDIGKKQSGKNLAKYIEKNKLGKIVTSPSKINPNSKNSLKVWISTINKKNLLDFWKKEKEKYIEKKHPYNNYWR